MKDFIQYLSEVIPEKDSLKIVKTESAKYYKEHSSKECYEIYPALYESDNFQIQEVGVFLAGYVADEYPDALAFLHDIVSQHPSWKVQEILAMSFDNYCAKIGYEKALPTIRAWFADENANVRRAASEGLRVWTSRKYFKEHPEIAIELLSSHKDDESEYVRKSAGNSLRDISKKFPELVLQELSTWDLSSKEVKQVHKLAGKFVLAGLETQEKLDEKMAINKMTYEISSILSDCEPSIYLYGSSVLDDFRLGWSDIDILVLTNRQISEEQAQKLVNLRQIMLEKEPGNPYYRSFEGGMLTLDAFISRSPDRVVYWGTSGERITDTYMFDSFGMAELIESGILLHGRDVRSWLSAPNLSDLYADIKHHYETIRKYVQKTEHSLYSFGWMLDIARCLYTLCTGKIIAKTAAAEWALENNLCPVPDVLKTALQVRKAPLEYKNNKQALDYAESLADPIQDFADVLEDELKRLEYDLKRSGISYGKP